MLIKFRLCVYLYYTDIIMDSEWCQEASVFAIIFCFIIFFIHTFSSSNCLDSKSTKVHSKFGNNSQK